MQTKADTKDDNCLNRALEIECPFENLFVPIVEWGVSGMACTVEFHSNS